ncbi:hypothetical protein [Aphanothece sacrum]|uniref:Phosphoserine phosphatase n=1 Tax=Aphanothece sacrum FPU1 TaxID=1920663 RepID=A0A401IDF3_APHSA|nr:hypothetical protein [Aphanothece sacrum]GBF79210.1 phosphoserine phosphatase [Aphanothece sacrum FPU1]GBF86600.1 phosphoserine phosphatase [Aphanothece sacrum FPU3]
MNKIFGTLMISVALAVVTPGTIAQSTYPSETRKTEINSTVGVNSNSVYQVGKVVGIVSGPNGTVLFVELANKTKVRFYYPGGAGNRGDQVVVLEKNGQYFLVNATPTNH